MALTEATGTLAAAHRKLTQGLPNRLREQWVNRVLRARLRERIGSLPPVTASDEARLEIHMLCGIGSWDMGVWASWSILRFLPEARLVVHSDGSLTPGTIRRWRQVVPQMQVTEKRDRDRLAEQSLADYPRLLDWRRNNIYSVQLIDMHMLASTDAVLSMDSDVLCFESPAEIRSAVDQSPVQSRWNQDLEGADFYLADRDQLEASFGQSPAQSVNAGFLFVPRHTPEDWAALEQWVVKLNDAGMDLRKAHAAQTLYALLIGERGQTFSDQYSVVDGPTQSSAVVRHYVTLRGVRPRFFTEGVTRLLKQVKHGAEVAS